MEQLNSTQLIIRDSIVDNTYKWNWDTSLEFGGNRGVAYRWLQIAIETNDSELATILLKRLNVPENLTIKEGISYLLLMDSDIADWGTEKI